MLASDEVILFDCTSGNLTAFLPAISGTIGKTYLIKKVDSSSNTVTIDPDASETIDGASSKVISVQNGFYILISTGVEWKVFGVNDTVGTGDVVGPGSATDNAITRFDSTTGKLVQNSSATVNDSGGIVAAGYASAVSSIKTTNYTVTESDSIIRVGTSGSIAFTVTLPTAVGITGREYTIVDVEGNVPIESVTVDGAGSETINSAANYVIDIAFEGVTVVSDGANWRIKSVFTTASGGNVVGPGSAVDSNVVFFDGTTGKLIKDSGLTLSGANTGDQNLFGTIAVAGQSDVVADSTSDTLTLAAGTGITITTDAATDTVTITNSVTDTGITELTGDVTAGPGSGSQAATLATVNANVGSFGSATAVGTFTVNGKGLITAASDTTITPNFANVLGGTAGSVIFSDGTNLAQDNANFFWDDTNNRLGIGTASPTYSLHVLNNSASVAPLALYKRGSSSSSISNAGFLNVDIQSSDDLMGTSQRALTFWIEPGSGAPLNRSYRGIEGDAIIPASDTGVYTSSIIGGLFQALYRGNSPGSIASATGLASTTGGQTGTGNITTVTGISSSVQQSGTGTVTNLYGVSTSLAANSGTLTNTYGYYAGDMTTGTQTNTPFSFYASDANAYNYFAGNVGIGTTSPGAQLQVTSSAAGTIGSIIKAAASQTADLTQWQNSSATVLSRIDASGRFGFGTAPSYPIHLVNVQTGVTTANYGIFVDHDVTVSADVMSDDSALGAVIRFRGSVNQTDANKGVSGFNVASFNYHTGTVARVSGARYDVRNLSTGTVTHLAANYVNTMVNSGGGTVTNTYGINIADQTVGTNNYGIVSALSSGSNKYNIYASGTAQNYFAGNVGIGTTAPSELLHVNGNMKVGASGTGKAYFNTSTTYVGSDVSNQLNLQGYGKLTLQTYGDGLASQEIVFSPRMVEAMRVMPGGNVGIGTTAPLAKLETAYGAGTTEANIKANVANNLINLQSLYTAGADYAPGIVFSSSDNNPTKSKAGIYSRFTTAGSWLYFGTSNVYGTGITNNALAIDPSGLVGLGSAAPASRLYVGGSRPIYLDPENTAGKGYGVFLQGSSGGAVQMFGFVGSGGTALNGFGALTSTDSLTRYFIGTYSSAERLTVLAAGNVGINEVAPGAQLQVTSSAAGTIGSIIKGAASQTADLTQWQNSSAGVLASMSSAGVLTLGLAGTQTGNLKLNGTTSGTVTVTPAAAAGTWTMTLPTTGGTNGYFLQTNGSGVTTWAAGGTGDVVGPGSATDNAITRFDSTTGKLVQNSSATVDDSGYLTANAYVPGSSYVNAQTGTTYTLASGDNGRIVTCSNASAITVTVTDASMPTDFMVTIYQLGAGQVSFTAGGTAVLRNVFSQTKIAGQYGAVTIKRVGSGTDFIISGSTGA